MLELCQSAANRPLNNDELATLNENNGGLDRTLGLRYTEVSASSVRAELTVSTDHLQPFGLVNGGVLCSLAESAGSLLGIVLAGCTPVSGVNNSTDFIKAVKAGIITVIATPLHNGSTSQLISVECYQRDQLVARSTLRTIRLHTS